MNDKKYTNLHRYLKDGYTDVYGYELGVQKWIEDAINAEVEMVKTPAMDAMAAKNVRVILRKKRK